MGKLSRTKKQQKAVAKEDPDFEKENGVSVPWKGSEPDYSDDDSGEFEKDEKVESKPPVITKTWLILGLLLAVAGILGVIGLRTGIVQGLLGDPNPYQGIGSVEPMGHVVFMVPFVLGIVALVFWGIKNDPIYNQIEEAKKGAEPIDDGDIPKESVEEVDEEESEVITEEPSKVEVMPEAIEPEEDLARIQKCEKMLSAVVVLPDDKKNLKELIDQGIPMEEFIEDIKKAIERRKKKEQEKDITADEKAAILEDELVVELGLLAGELEDDEFSMEDQIIKELEDLEGL